MSLFDALRGVGNTISSTTTTGVKSLVGALSPDEKLSGGSTEYMENGLPKTASALDRSHRGMGVVEQEKARLHQQDMDAARFDAMTNLVERQPGESEAEASARISSARRYLAANPG
jgi:hypothetical protein